MNRIAWVVALPLLAACSGISVSHDYDPQADFSKLRSYAWHTASPETPSIDSLTFQRIVRAVDDGLAARGYRKTEEAPDFKVHASATVKQKLDAQTVPLNTGYGWRHGYMAESTVVMTYDEGTLIVDVIAPETKNLIWRGTARAVVEMDRTPEQREGRIREAVAKILDKFPPVKSK